MELTRVALWNLALGKIKIGTRLRSLEDEGARRHMLPEIHALVLGQLLERHPWSFATKTEKLGKVAPGAEVRMPNGIYRHAWTIPHDCHKVLSVGMYMAPRRATPGVSEGESFDFSRSLHSEIVMGPASDRVILTAHDRACILYLSNGIPEALWPAGFVQAMTWALAAEITRAENASDSDADYRMKQAHIAFEAARRADVLDNGGGRRLHGDFLQAREIFSDLKGWVGGGLF